MVRGREIGREREKREERREKRGKRGQRREAEGERVDRDCM